MSAGSNRFPTIGSYGFLSDCHTSVLVSYDGSVEWLCLPRFDSPSVFGALLDRDAGHFRLAPREVVVPISRRYQPGTLVIETTWVADSGWVVVHDALTIGDWVEQTGPGSRPRTSSTKGSCSIWPACRSSADAARPRSGRISGSSRTSRTAAAATTCARGSRRCRATPPGPSAPSSVGPRWPSRAGRNFR